MSGRLVGIVDASDRRSLRFAYDQAYAADSAATPLSVSMPLRVSPYSHATVVLARPLGLGLDEAHARIADIADRLPDALADAANSSSLTIDEQRVAKSIREQITEWAAERARGLA